MPVRQAPTLEATIWVANSIEEMINNRTTNKVEVGKKRKFEGSSRSNKSNMFSKSNKRGGKGKWCEKCKNKHFGKYGRKVNCFKCRETGHYADECTFTNRVCYRCTEGRHLSRDRPKKNEAPRANAPPKPKSILEDP